MEASVRTSDPDSPTPYRDHCSRLHIGRVRLQNLPCEINPLRGRHIRKPQQTGMWSALNKEQFTEVGVDRYEDAPLSSGPFQEHAVTRIGSTRRGLDDIVPLLPQPLTESVASTPINQESHRAAISTASRESRAMTACA